MSLFDLTGKVALVTGATKGIGLGVAQQLAAFGAKVVVSSRDAAQCEKVAEELRRTHGNGANIAAGLPCDIGKRDEVLQLAGAAEAAFGGIDILVCNAAILPFIGSSVDTPHEQFDRILTDNIHNNFRLCHAIRPGMARRGGGSMILIGSMSGHTASPHTMAYSIAKAGIAHMARCLADEFASQRIRVNCVAPGLVRTFSSRPLWENSEILASVTAGIPLGRIGEPSDIAGAVVYLASQAGSYVTGTVLMVDGGQVNLSVPSPTSDGVTNTLSGVKFN
jgi:NAD(P)-dependent dehydrogenase (short-subunit alcohol dehydrogenase family)